jgi:hypothetical protein
MQGWLTAVSRDMNKVLHYVNGSYANYINKKRNRVGHLLQGRHKGIPVERDAYLLELSRYLHLNPVRAKMVERLKASLNSCRLPLVQSDPGKSSGLCRFQ